MNVGVNTNPFPERDTSSKINFKSTIDNEQSVEMMKF